MTKRFKQNNIIFKEQIGSLSKGGMRLLIFDYSQSDLSKKESKQEKI